MDHNPKVILNNCVSKLMSKTLGDILHSIKMQRYYQEFQSSCFRNKKKNKKTFYVHVCLFTVSAKNEGKYDFFPPPCSFLALADF